MPFVQAVCPNCNGPLTVDRDKDAAICEHCGAPFIIEKAINSYNTIHNYNLEADPERLMQFNIDKLIENGNVAMYELHDYDQAYSFYEKATHQNYSDYRGHLGLFYVDTVIYQTDFPDDEQFCKIKKHKNDAIQLAPEDQKQGITDYWNNFFYNLQCRRKNEIDKVQAKMIKAEEYKAELDNYEKETLKKINDLNKKESANRNLYNSIHNKVYSLQVPVIPLIVLCTIFILMVIVHAFEHINIILVIIFFIFILIFSAILQKRLLIRKLNKTSDLLDEIKEKLLNAGSLKSEINILQRDNNNMMSMLYLELHKRTNIEYNE